MDFKDGILKIQAMFGLEYPDPKYLTVLLEQLQLRKWRKSELSYAVNILLGDSEYANQARFGRYPTVADFERVRPKPQNKRLNEFRERLSFILDDNGWDIQNFAQWCNSDELRAIAISGGISDLCNRANREFQPVAISRLLSEVEANLSSVRETQIALPESRIGMKSIGNIVKQIKGE